MHPFPRPAHLAHCGGSLRTRCGDKAFKSSSTSSSAEVAKQLEAIYGHPIKRYAMSCRSGESVSDQHLISSRLNLLGNFLRSDTSSWNSFSSAVPSLINLQFACQTLVLSLNELTHILTPAHALWTPSSLVI